MLLSEEKISETQTLGGELPYTVKNKGNPRQKVAKTNKFATIVERKVTSKGFVIPSSMRIS